MGFIVTAIAIIVIVWAILIRFEFTCLIHRYQSYVPTEHLSIDKDGKLRGWKRHWQVCERCGKRKPGKKVVQ